MVIEISVIPWSTLSIMLIAVVISFLNTSVNRLLITRFVGWKEYHVMQNEISEYRSQTTKAMRSKDKQLQEKLKKKESQISNMQKKMAKPQLLLFGISMSYILIWLFVLTPTYGNAGAVAYVPGYGGIPYIYWYFLSSIFLGTIAGRIIGVMPIK
ncbi:DUF106 domain-containing protein [Candidatus Bathyarchaeota archaeon]|nr:DUF106 domain-containing protein [Candidatus Bathyarchaeota archaeon]